MPRAVCASCGEIHYQNPRIIAGCIPVIHHQGEDKVLLCRRAIEPRLGFWTYPSGFMEMGESVEEAAARETLEEAKASVEVGQLLSVISVPHINQVHMAFVAHLERPEFDTSHESSEVVLFALDKIPWEEIAFPSVYESLKHFVAQHPHGQYSLYQGVVTGRAH